MNQVINEAIIFCATYLIYIAAVYAVLHVFLKHDRRHHLLHVATVLGSGLIGWVIAHILKPLIAHARPDLTTALIMPDDLYSFPSGHATFMFALAFAMYGFNKRAGKILFILAFVAGAARVLAGVHYWYDILGGLVLGAGVASIMYLVLRRFFK